MTLENRKKMAQLYLDGKAPEFFIYAKELNMLPGTEKEKEKPKKKTKRFKK